MTMRDDVKRLGGLREAGKELEGQGEPEAIGAARGVAYFDGTGRVATRTAEQTQAGAATPAVPNDVVSAVSNEVQGESASSRANASGVQLSDFDKAVQASYDTLKAGEWPEYQSLSGITGLFDCTTGEGVRLAFGETAEAQQLPVYRDNCRQGLKPGWDSVAAYREGEFIDVTQDVGYRAGEVYYSTTFYPLRGIAAVRSGAELAVKWAEYEAIDRQGYYFSETLPYIYTCDYLLWQCSASQPNNYYPAADFYNAARVSGEQPPSCGAGEQLYMRCLFGNTLTNYDCANPGGSSSTQNFIQARCAEFTSDLLAVQEAEPCENGETDPAAEDCNPLNLITNPCDLNPNEPYTCESESEWDSAECYREEKRGGLKAGWDSVSAYREEVGCAPVEGFVAGEFYRSAVGGSGFYNLSGGVGFAASPEAAFMQAAEKAAPNSYGAMYVGRTPSGGLYYHAGISTTVTWNLNGYFNNEIVKIWNDPTGLIGRSNEAPFGGGSNSMTAWPGTCSAVPSWHPDRSDPDFIAWCALTEAPIECDQYLEQCENGETDPNAEDCNPLELTQAQQCCPDPATVEPCDWQDDCLADYLVSDSHRISSDERDPNANLPSDISAAQFCDAEGNEIQLIPAKEGGYIVSNQTQNVNLYRDPAGKVSYFDNTKIIDYQVRG